MLASSSSLAAACTAAARVDAMLQAKGKLCKPPPFIKIGSSPKSSGDIFSTEFEINDIAAPARNILTKGVTQDEISAYSGAAVSTRGRYFNPEEKACKPGERALYLYIQGPTKQSIDLAIQRIEQIVMNHSLHNVGPPSQSRQSRFKMGPPQTNLPPPSIMSPQFTSIPPPLMSLSTQMPGHGIVEKVITGMDNAPPAFDIRNKLLGVGGANLQYMRSETGAMVTLRGKGSGFIEPTTGVESPEPLHFYLEHSRSEGIQEARTLAINLIETLQQDLQQFQQQQQILTFQPGGLQTVQVGQVGQTGLLTFPPEMLQQAGLVTTSIANINVPTILTQQQAIGPLVVPPPPLGVPPPNIMQQSQQLQQQVIQSQVQLPPPGIHIPTHQGPLVPPQSQQQPQQQLMHQIQPPNGQFLHQAGQQPPQHLMAQPPPPIQQVLLSQAPPVVSTQAQPPQVLYQQPPPQSQQQASQQQQVFVSQAGLPILHQPPPVISTQLHYHVQQQQSASQPPSHQLMQVPPPPPPTQQQLCGSAQLSNPQVQQSGQQIPNSFLGQAVPLQYTLQFQQTNHPASSPAPHPQSIVDQHHQQPQQHSPQLQQNHHMHNQAPYLQIPTSGLITGLPGQPSQHSLHQLSSSQTVINAVSMQVPPPPPLQMPPGMMAPPQMQQMPSQQASMGLPMPVPAPVPPTSGPPTSSSTLQAVYSQTGIMTQSPSNVPVSSSHLPPLIHQQQLSPQSQQIQFNMQQENLSPISAQNLGQILQHGPGSPTVQDRNSPSSQDTHQCNRSKQISQQSQPQQDGNQPPLPSSQQQRQGIGIEELMQMNHQQRQQLSVQPGTAQNGQPGPQRHDRDKSVAHPPSSSIGQDNWRDNNAGSGRENQIQIEVENTPDERDMKSSGLFEEESCRELNRERQRDLERREARDLNGRVDYERSLVRSGARSDGRLERERNRDRDRERPTYNHYESKPQLYNPSLPFHMHGLSVCPPPPPPPPPVNMAVGNQSPQSPQLNPQSQQQQSQAQQSSSYQSSLSQGYYPGWGGGVNPYAWMGQ